MVYFRLFSVLGYLCFAALPTFKLSSEMTPPTITQNNFGKLRMNLLDFDAYFFDFDGLLADTEPLHLKAYQVLLERRGYKLTWDLPTYCSFAHQKTAIFAEKIYTMFPLLREEQPVWENLRQEKMDIYLKLLEENKVDLMPGVAEILTHLEHHHKPVYVVTNAPVEQVERIKHHHSCFKNIKYWITRDLYENPKPAPDSYMKALEFHGDLGCKAVGFEDAIRGIESLKQTPIKPIMILARDRDGYNPSMLDGIERYFSFEELLP